MTREWWRFYHWTSDKEICLAGHWTTFLWQILIMVNIESGVLQEGGGRVWTRCSPKELPWWSSKCIFTLKHIESQGEVGSEPSSWRWQPSCVSTRPPSPRWALWASHIYLFLSFNSACSSWCSSFVGGIAPLSSSSNQLEFWVFRIPTLLLEFSASKIPILLEFSASKIPILLELSASKIPTLQGCSSLLEVFFELQLSLLPGWPSSIIPGDVAASKISTPESLPATKLSLSNCILSFPTLKHCWSSKKPSASSHRQFPTHTESKSDNNHRKQKFCEQIL